MRRITGTSDRPHARPGAAPHGAHPGRGRRRTRLDALVGLVLLALVCTGGWALVQRPAEPALPPPPSSTLPDGVAGPPTRAAARYQARYRSAPTVEEYETARASRALSPAPSRHFP